MDTSKKKDVIKNFATHANDTGSIEVQVAILTTRINDLTEHLKIHKKDLHSRNGLMKMIGKRRSLLNYLERIKPEAYKTVIADLELRK